MSVRILQRIIVLSLLGLGAALLGADLLLGKSKAVPSAPQRQVAAYAVIRAANPLSRGSVILPQDIAVASSTAEPALGSVTSIADASGRVATKNIARDELLSNANTSVAPGLSGLAQLIPQGMRAVAVRVTDELAVANLIRPGDRVDLLVISNGVRPQRGEETPFPSAEVRTILQNIQVLAVGETIVGSAPNAKDYRNVTLAVSPKEAGMVALARTVGTQYLSLRAADDINESREPWALTTDDLRFSTMSTQAGPPAQTGPAARSVEIITGASNQRQTVVVPQGGEP